jgi:hypothetical protein
MADTEDRIVTLRRSLEQAHHCIEEALSVVNHGEDLRCAEDDVWQATELLKGKVRQDLERLQAVRARMLKTATYGKNGDPNET